jgi:hypothetical protein
MAIASRSGARSIEFPQTLSPSRSSSEHTPLIVRRRSGPHFTAAEEVETIRREAVVLAHETGVFDAESA